MPAERASSHRELFSAVLELAAPRTYGDYDDDGETAHEIPQSTIELAAGIADWSGLHGDTPAWFNPGYSDPLRPPGAPVTVYDAPADPIGYGPPPQERPSYPGIAQLARDMGLK